MMDFWILNYHKEKLGVHFPTQIRRVVHLFSYVIFVSLLQPICISSIICKRYVKQYPYAQWLFFD